MTDETLKSKLAALLASWKKTGPPSSSETIRIAEELLLWKKSAGLTGLWHRPPVMLTATLDDGWGNGLKPIHLWAELAGVEVIHMGLLRPARDIVEVCLRQRPDIIGLTVLQLDSLEDLEEIATGVPAATTVIVGGPIFRRTANDGWRERGYYAARDAAAFVDFLLAEYEADTGQ